MVGLPRPRDSFSLKRSRNVNLRDRLSVLSFLFFSMVGMAIVALASALPNLAAHSRPSVGAQATSEKGAISRQNALLLGAAWYPEQWPESRWEEDLRLMEAAHITFARVGEFAWSRMEPSEGKFDFDWLERAINMAAQHHVAIVLGTPTDAPPAWLTQKYPETLRVDSNGRRAEHGGRRQFSYSSPRYRELCRIVVDRLAARFAANPNVIGWQIGNEY